MSKKIFITIALGFSTLCSKAQLINDEPTGAITLPIYSQVAGFTKTTTTNGSLSTFFPTWTNPANYGNYVVCSSGLECGGITPTPRDVWFKFNSGSNTNLNFNVHNLGTGLGSTIAQNVFKLFSASSLSPITLTSAGCECGTFVTPLETFTMSVTANTNYFIAISTKNGVTSEIGSKGPFEIGITGLVPNIVALSLDENSF